MKPLLYILFLLLSSCGIPRALYIHTPDKSNVPCLTKRGDVRLDASAKLQGMDSSAGAAASFSADAAYALTDHIGVIASYRGINNRGVKHTAVTSMLFGGSEEQHFLLNGYRFDAGAGVYHGLSKHWLIEAFGCLGAGMIQNSSPYIDPGYYKAKFVNGSAQFDFSLVFDVASFSIGNKFAVFNYYDFNHIGNPSLNDQVYPIKGKTSLYTTAFIQLAAGYKYVKVSMQAGAEIGITERSEPVFFRPSPVYMTLGLSFQLNALSAKRPK